MAVDGDQAVLVPDEHRVAELLEAVSGIDDDAVLRCLDRRTLRYGNVDAVAILAAAAAIAGDHRPRTGQRMRAMPVASGAAAPLLAAWSMTFSAFFGGV